MLYNIKGIIDSCKLKQDRKYIGPKENGEKDKQCHDLQNIT